MVNWILVNRGLVSDARLLTFCNRLFKLRKVVLLPYLSTVWTVRVFSRNARISAARGTRSFIRRCFLFGCGRAAWGPRRVNSSGPVALGGVVLSLQRMAATL